MLILLKAMTKPDLYIEIAFKSNRNEINIASGKCNVNKWLYMYITRTSIGINVSWAVRAETIQGNEDFLFYNRS